MKKIVLLAGLVFMFAVPVSVMAGGVSALPTVPAAQGGVQGYALSGASGVAGYALPRTAIEVTVQQQREVLIRGPYARFAAKYLGVTGVAQSDKESYKLLGASIKFMLEADPAAVYSFDAKGGAPAGVVAWLPGEAMSSASSSASVLSGVVSDKDYNRAQIGMMTPFGDMGVSSTYGKTSMAMPGGAGIVDFPVESVLRGDAVEKSVEQMAAEAASAVFKLRKRRFELITGDQGENVYGQGLPAALAEIDRLEAEYMSLFIGKRFVQNSSRRFVVVPTEVGKGRLTVCRFSDNGGVTSATDVSGRPLNLEFTPERAVSVAGGDVRRAGGRVVQYRVPSMEVVRLMDDLELLDEVRMPMYQFGKLVDVPVL